MANKNYNLNNNEKKDTKMADWLEQALEKIDGLENKGNKKNYNLGDSPNKDVKDEIPEWIKPVFDAKKQEPKKNPFEGVNDPILNPNKDGVEKKKCKICGCVLSNNEAGTCKKCS